MAEKKVELGDRVKDSISGCQGIAIARTTYLTGCDRIGVQGEALKDGAPIDWQWFDVNQLKVVKKGAKKIVGEKPGGPRPAPRNAPSTG
jgi:hypothetical protein